MKRFLTLLALCALLITGASAKTVFNHTNYPAQIKVSASALNVRSGPGTWFTKVGTVYNGQIISCVGKIGNWFVVHLDNDTVGLVSGDYAKPYYPPTAPPAKTPPPTAAPPSADLGTAAEKTMLALVNSARAQNGVAPLVMDANLLKIARLKSKDMVDYNYFSHTSPSYGSPFDMMKAFGITYRTAGENIAANNTVENAHSALMGSPGHKQNILNSSFNYVGIGIVSSPKYGLMITQMFVGR